MQVQDSIQPKPASPSPQRSPSANGKPQSSSGFINHITSNKIQTFGALTSAGSVLWIVPKFIRRLNEGELLSMWKELSMHIMLAITGIIIAVQAKPTDESKSNKD